MTDTPTPDEYARETERAVLVVFDACRFTGASLATSHRVATLVAEELERIHIERSQLPQVAARFVDAP